MLILGANSDISKAFVEKVLQEEKTIKNLYLVTSNKELTVKYAQHLEVKTQQKSQVIELDLLSSTDFFFLDTLDFETVFCATGYLGLNTEEGIYDEQNTSRIIDINYAKLVPLLNKIAEKLEKKGKGDIIILSSVAGDRGRQSNFIYGSAKAAITTYASGLRNYLHKKGVHVMTVKPGFMDTKMTQGLDLPKPVTAQPDQVAHVIYKAYKKKKNEVYVLWMWRYIMLIIKNIPEFIFKKLSL